MLDLVFLAVAIVSASYLGYRAVDVAARQLPSYRALDSRR